MLYTPIHKKRPATKTCTNLKHLYYIPCIYWSFEFRCGGYKWGEECFVIITISEVMLNTYEDSLITSEAGVYQGQWGMLRSECLSSLLHTACINLT